MKDILKIGVILMVLVGMTGFAYASTTDSPSPLQIDVFGNTETVITVTHRDNVGYATNGTFEIFLDGTKTISTDLTGTIDNGANWGQMGYSAPHNTYMDGSEYVSTWTFKVKDNGDANDNAQVGVEYDIFFTADIDDNRDWTIFRGSATSDTTAVPEFPTIALPVAAIIGLAFILQRRNEE